MSTELRNTRHEMSSEGTSGVQSRMAPMNQARVSSGNAEYDGSALNIAELPPVKPLHIGQFAAHEVMDTKTREPMDIHNHPMYPPSISQAGQSSSPTSAAGDHPLTSEQLTLVLHTSYQEAISRIDQNKIMLLTFSARHHQVRHPLR